MLPIGPWPWGPAVRFQYPQICVKHLDGGFPVQVQGVRFGGLKSDQFHLPCISPVPSRITTHYHPPPITTHYPPITHPLSPIAITKKASTTELSRIPRPLRSPHTHTHQQTPDTSWPPRPRPVLGELGAQSSEISAGGTWDQGPSTKREASHSFPRSPQSPHTHTPQLRARGASGARSPGLLGKIGPILLTTCHLPIPGLDNLDDELGVVLLLVGLVGRCWPKSTSCAAMAMAMAVMGHGSL
jgi:hypothetical protein